MESARILPSLAERRTAFEAPLSESMRARIEAAGVALFVDLAGVVLGALVLVADHVVGGADLLEALLVPAFGIGVKLLGQAPESLLDVRFAGGLRNAEHFVWVAHASARVDKLSHYIGCGFTSR